MKKVYAALLVVLAIAVAYGIGYDRGSPVNQIVVATPGPTTRAFFATPSPTRTPAAVVERTLKPTPTKTPARTPTPAPTVDQQAAYWMASLNRQAAQISATPTARKAFTNSTTRTPKPTLRPTPSPTKRTVRAAATKAPSKQTYIGNKNTKKFHYPTCSSVGQMKESNKVTLASRDEAINKGYVPCKKCNP